jgi:uncharacterized membrane protein
LTLAHFLYIPLVLAVGIFLGWALGARSSRIVEAERAERARRRAAEGEVSPPS